MSIPTILLHENFCAAEQTKLIEDINLLDLEIVQWGQSPRTQSNRCFYSTFLQIDILMRHPPTHRYTCSIYSTHAIYPRKIKKQTRGVIYIRNNSIYWKGCRKHDRNNFIDPVGCKKYEDTSSAWNVIRYLLNPSDCKKFAIVMASPWPKTDKQTVINAKQ